MSAPLVLRWSIHSRDAVHALERLIAWLEPESVLAARLYFDRARFSWAPDASETEEP
jgi:hypothetical protein